MQAFYDATFSREVGCTEAEWLGWLPAAMGQHTWQCSGQTASVEIKNADGSMGRMQVKWQDGVPRQIALMRIPRLLVSFEFEGLTDAQRYTFMRRFDLYMQRGGG